MVMKILVSPDGQNVQVPSASVSERISQGYRVPPGVSTPPAGVLNVAGKKKKTAISDKGSPPLDLMKATMQELIDLPDIGTAKAKKVKALVDAGSLSIDTLQDQVKGVDWGAMYEKGIATWPGGVSVANPEVKGSSPEGEANDQPETE